MGFFKKLFGGSEVPDEITDPIEINEKYGLKPYVKGEISTLINEKSYQETFKKFGFKGVVLHSQIKSHFLYLDCLSDYFNRKPSQKPNFKLQGRTWRTWDDNDTHRNSYDQLQEVFKSNKLISSHDTSMNIEGYMEMLENQTDKLINKISSSGFGSYKGTGDCYSYKPYAKYYYVGLEKSDSGVIEELYKYLFSKDNLDFIKEQSKHLIGWNSLFFFTPFHVIHTNHELHETENIFIQTSDYNHHFPLHMDLTSLRGISRDDVENLKKWMDIQTWNYQEILINEYKQVKVQLFEMFGFEKEIMSLKKNSFEIHKGNEKFTSDSNHIVRHLNDTVSIIEDSFNSLIVDTGVHGHSKGYLFQNEESFLKTQFIESKIFEFSIICNLTNLLIESIKEKNDFLYQEIYLMIEPYNVFDRTIEKQTLSELKDLKKELSSLNNNLVNLNNNLTKGFNMLSSQLQSLNNKMSNNNILSSINTYQLHKISKKL